MVGELRGEFSHRYNRDKDIQQVVDKDLGTMYLRVEDVRQQGYNGRVIPEETCKILTQWR